MGSSSPACKIVTILIGDNPDAFKEAEHSLKCGYPVIILEGSKLNSHIFGENVEEEKKDPNEIVPYNFRRKRDPIKNIEKTRLEFVREAKYFRCPDSSEELACLVHLLLTVTI